MPGEILNRDILNFSILNHVLAWDFFLELKVLLSYDAINLFADCALCQILFKKGVILMPDKVLGKNIIEFLILACLKV